jgi:hypothetical protein
MKAVPFNYMVRSGRHYCPKCNILINASDRRVCTGNWVKRVFGFCPTGEHFHRKCYDCGGKWSESTFESSDESAIKTLRRALELAEKSGITEDTISSEFRNITVKQVMDS